MTKLPNTLSKTAVLAAAALLALTAAACKEFRQLAGDAPRGFQEPTFEVTPLGKKVGEWQTLGAEAVNFTVTAPGAQQVTINYRPAAAVQRYVKLKTLNKPTDPGGQTFVGEWKANPDFIGEVWAEATYPDGTTKQTSALAIASPAAVSQQAASIPADRIGPTRGMEDSERSDKITGGEIKRAELVEGDPRVWITINVPAFQLTLWQAGKEIKTYPIGIGRKDYPLPVGERQASEIIWNPDWVPPDSAWVLKDEDVEPGERIEADDPRNPLGKIKIRLGNAVLIHEAASKSDIGRLVSHGCARMLTEDIFDLANKLVAARNLPVSREQINRARASTERLAVKLDPPVWVDINYDTEVIEGGTLRLYPDVYGLRKRDVVARLRDELAEAGVDPSAVGDAALRQMAERVSMKQQFVVSLDDLRAGRGLEAGRTEPLTTTAPDKDTRQAGRPAPREATGRR